MIGDHEQQPSNIVSYVWVTPVHYRICKAVWDADREDEYRQLIDWTRRAPVPSDGWDTIKGAIWWAGHTNWRQPWRSVRENDGPFKV